MILVDSLGRRRQKDVKHSSEAVRQQAIEMYSQGGFHHKEIAKKLGFSTHAVREWTEDIVLTEDKERNLLLKKGLTTSGFEQKIDNEIWKLIPGWKGYQISNAGKIRNTFGLLSKTKIRHGRHFVQSTYGREYVGDLVADVFLSNEDKRYVYYKDGNTLNDCVDNIGLSCFNQHLKKSVSVSVKQQMIIDYVENELPMYKISEKYGVTDGTVRRCLKATGNRIRDKHEKMMPPDIVKKVVEEYLNGETTTNLSKKYNVVRKTIQRWLHNNNIKTINQQERKYLHLTEDIKKNTISLYVDKELNCAEIAKQLGIPPGMVRKWLSKYQVKRKTQSEIWALMARKGTIKPYGNNKRGIINTRFGEIRYDSIYERDRLIQLQNDVNVTTASRCEFIIPYYVNGGLHNYNPDLYIEKYVNGKITKIVEEIKPLKYLNEKNYPARHAAGKKYCESKNIAFYIITELDIYNSRHYKRRMYVKEAA